jgi:adenylate cyclase
VVWVSGKAHFIARRYEEAVEFTSESLGRKPDSPGAYRLLAAANAYLGNLSEAAAAVEEMVRLAPDISEQHLQSFLPKNIAQNYIKGLRLAGWKGQAE